MQLFLVYKGRFSWQDVDTMPIYELLWNYNTLIKWKKEEQEAMKGEEGHSPSDFFNETENNPIFNSE